MAGLAGAAGVAAARVSLEASVMASIIFGSIRVNSGAYTAMVCAVSGRAMSVQSWTGAARKVSAWAAVDGRIGLSAVTSTRNRFRPWVQTDCSCASAPSCLAITHGFWSSM
ncbi:hypothetical protein D3C71_1418070 [compost metagenome]